MSIKVIRKRPGEAPELISMENTLKAMQDAVDGYIEVVTIATDLAIICDEEGRLASKEPNCVLCGVDFVGTILVVGIRGDGFCDVPVRMSMLIFSTAESRICPVCQNSEISPDHSFCKICGHDLRNEKAPAEGQFQQSADQKDQLQDTCNPVDCQDEVSEIGVLDQLVKLQGQYKQLYESTGLIAVDSHSVHVNQAFFFQHFEQYMTENMGDPRYPFKFLTKYDDVQFFCIGEKPDVLV